jgi:hypothetical protein
MRMILDRREWLRLSGLLGVGMTPILANANNASPGFGRAKSVLIVFTSGGMSQFETWDPKPDAPKEIRGAFGTIPTTIPGVRFGEHMPKTAAIANQLTILRSMTHDDLDHGSAVYLALTGQFHARKSGNPPVSPKDLPTLGSVLHRIRPSRDLPQSAAYLNGPVLVPDVIGPGQNGGFLGRKYDPFTVRDVTKLGDSIGPMVDQESLSAIRLKDRVDLVQQLDQLRAKFETQGQEHSQALALLETKKYRDAFRLEMESEATHQAYGQDRAGQACLLARRLVEAGMPLVLSFFNHTIRGQDTHPETTDEYGWDTHNDVFYSLKTHLLPRFDRTFPVLMEDLKQRGLLDSTLVICMGEFGRAQLVAVEKNFAGSSPGRKHWAMCYSIAMAGAGIQGAKTIGSSDRRGAYPSEQPITPGDLFATIYHALGIDPRSHYEDFVNRGYPIATGQVIKGLWA